MLVTVRFVLAALLAFAVVLIVGGTYADDYDKPESISELSGDEIKTTLDSLFLEINSQYQQVKPIFERSCYDCHSQSTNYPWYYKLPVVKGIIDDDIAEGLEHLDLSGDFPFRGKGTLLELLGEIKEEIEKDKMPPTGYRMLHWGRLIENEKRDSVFQWIDQTVTLLEDFYSQSGNW